MGKTMAVALCFLCPAAAAAANNAILQGQWNIEAVSLPTYSGVLLIDAEHRATWDAPADNGKPAKFQGYVARIDGPKIEIALTDRSTVARVHCIAQSSELLNCYLVFVPSGVPSRSFALRRVGAGPQKLVPILP